jgi:hypothetical protein
MEQLHISENVLSQVETSCQRGKPKPRAHAAGKKSALLQALQQRVVRLVRADPEPVKVIARLWRLGEVDQ